METGAIVSKAGLVFSCFWDIAVLFILLYTAFKACKGVGFVALPQEKRYTFADIQAGSEDEHIELIYGVPRAMATPNRIHQEISGELFGQLYDYLKGKKCKVYAAPFTVRLFEQDGDFSEDVDTVVIPDISVICDPDKLDDKGCKGAPDLIIEILSPSTQRHDRVTKFNLYQRAGVQEYWIVEPVNQSVQSFILQNDHYISNEFKTAGEEIKVSVLEGCTIDLSQVFPE